MYLKRPFVITPKLGIRINRLRDGWSYFWLFIGFATLSCFLYFFLEFYVYHFGKQLWYNYKTSPERFIRIIEESFIGTFLVVIVCLLILDIIMETNKLIHWGVKQLHRIQLNKRFWLILSCVISGIFLIWGANFISSGPQLSPELKSLENQAEKGDTVALHKLLIFYDNNSDIIIEVVEAIDAYGNEIIGEEDKELFDNDLNELYLERLHYWLNKGLAIDDPVAKSITGRRLYYEDESAAIPHLAEMAENGDGQAALLCGSAYFNQGKAPEAFKYLTMAYEMGIPSAGWHLAMCYSRGYGTKQNKEKAIEVLKHSALLNYPEAVLEMKRIEPNNQLWQNKADSLEIDFPDFVIIDE